MLDKSNDKKEYRGVIDEIREQQDKTKAMTVKDKLKYFWDYYKIHTIVGVIALLVIIYFICNLVTAKDYCFYGIMMNAQNLSGSNMEEGFASYACLDTDKYECFIDAESTLTYATPTEYDYATMQKLVALVQTKELDAVVFDSQCFGRYAMNEFFVDLRTVLSPEEQTRFQDYYYYVDQAEITRLNEEDEEVNMEEMDKLNQATVEEQLLEAELHRDPSTMKEPIPVGIYMADSSYEKGTSSYKGFAPIFGIVCTSERKATAVTYLNYLWSEDTDFGTMINEKNGSSYN